MVFGVTPPRIEPESTVLAADALSNRPQIGSNQTELRQNGLVAQSNKRLACGIQLVSQNVRFRF